MTRHFKGVLAIGFRGRLLAAIMVTVTAVTGAVLYVSQRDAVAAVQQRLANQFQAEISYLLGAQQARRAATEERCRNLARSVRIRAALEEGSVDDLYLNADVELRDLLERQTPGDARASRSFRVHFFRFLDAAGRLLPPAGNAPGAAEWESALIPHATAVREQQIGYVVQAETGSAASTVVEVIVTPIFATDTGEIIGSIALGFEPLELRWNAENSGIKSGILVGDYLGMPFASRESLAAIAGVARKLIDGASTEGSSVRVSVGGAEYLLFQRLLNPGSPYPAAYHVCLYPLAEMLIHQREMRWRIISAGMLALLVGLFLSHVIASRFARPVEELEVASLVNREQRVKAEAALELTEQKYRSIFENALEGIFLFAPDGRFLSLNPALANIYGFESPREALEALPKGPAALYENEEQFEAFLADASLGVVSRFEAVIRRGDGQSAWISHNGRPVLDSAGALLHIEGSCEDITERRRSASELLALNAELQTALTNLRSTQQQVIQQERLRALGQMASGIAHDFNNALVPIVGFCELLILNPSILADAEKAGRYLETIQTAAKDAASVVSRLREFYRPDKNDRPFEPVDIKRLVEQTVILTRPKWKDQAQANGVTIEVALELERVPVIAGEESALREALTNLVFNAVDAMPEGGTLTFRTSHAGDYAVLEISDTGTGMPEDVRKQCLEPFFSTKGERGTGLGLSMVFGIVQRHSGQLELHSEVGKGTTFLIRFPLMDAQRQTGAGAKQMRHTVPPMRVLVVDDEAPVRDTLSAVLTADGHEVAVARTGSEGLKVFMEGRIDLIVTDKAMPGMSGDQMATAIKQLSPTTPIILLTGFGLFHEKPEFPSVDILISKPIRIPALREAIWSAVKPG